MKHSTPHSIPEPDAKAKEEFPAPVRRPLSVTIASWVLIVWPSAALTLFLIPMLYSSKDRKQALAPDTLLAVASMLIILWFGIGMRRGLKWARLLWLWFVPAVIVFLYIAEPDGFPFAVIIYAIYAVILNRRPARLYFTRGGL